MFEVVLKFGHFQKREAECLGWHSPIASKASGEVEAALHWPARDKGSSSRQQEMSKTMFVLK